MPDPPGYRPSNPFRSANIRPGANDFLFADPTTWQHLLDQVKQHQFCEIVGRHGTGKSTLFGQVTAACESWGWLVRRHVMDPHRPPLEPLPLEAIPFAAEHQLERLLAVDGYEQLTRSQRRAIRQHCRTQGKRLLITSHASEGLHLLHHTQVDVPMARKVIAAVLEREGVTWTVDDALLERLLTKHPGNLREVMFELFDLYTNPPAPAARGTSP